MASSVVQFRVEEELKAQATELFAKLGIDLSTALRIFLKRSVAAKGLPFSMTLENDTMTEIASDEEVSRISENLMKINSEVYKELAE